MNPDPILPDRLRPEGAGLGHPSEAEIERRATEIALSDGRTSFTDADLARSARELSGGEPVERAPEVDPASEQLTGWDDPVDASGHRVDSLPVEDETSVAERLIQDGLEEADHDQRVRAEEAQHPEES